MLGKKVSREPLNFRLSLAILILLILSLPIYAKAKVQTWIDPNKAIAEDPDFMIQGEYGGSKHGIGVQVVALGDGSFDLFVLQGGLPGDGWKRGQERIKVQGSLNAGVVNAKNTQCQIQIENGLLKLKKGNKDFKLKRIERKSPTLGQKPPKGAIVLFDGSSAKEWQKGRMDKEKLLIQGTKSKQTFGDHKIHLEFRTPYKPKARGQGRGNSGLYVQSRYETQILDSFALEGKMNEAGGIYSIKRSDVNMCFPPLQWQTYDIDFTAAKFQNGKKVSNARMTVKLNGVVIHNNVELPKATTAAPLKVNPQNGPMYLQDHGNPVRFRNIWVVNKTSPAPKVSWTNSPKGYEKVDKVIKLSVKHSQLKYDKDIFKVPTNAKIKLVFENTDEMAHNVVFTKIGTDTKKIGEAAMALGEKGLAMQYIPKSDKILYYTKMIEPGKKGTIYFTTPKKSGDYPYVCTFPGHYLIMKGIMRVGEVKSYGLKDLSYKLYKGSFKKLPDFSKLKTSQSGKLEDGLVTLKVSKQKENFAIVYEGQLEVLQSGRFFFNLSSDDGSKLYIGKQVVVNNDGTHAMANQSGELRLRAGKHPFRLEYFQGGGGLGLSLGWKRFGKKLPDLSSSEAASFESKYDIVVEDTPRIYRTGLNLPGMSKGAYSVAVGMPGKVNYCFDAKKCYLRAVWTGEFLNAKADWAGRGGNGARPKGNVFYKNNNSPPLKFENVNSNDINYIGYRLNKGYPTFMYEVGEGILVSQSFKPNQSNSGVVQSFEIKGAKGKIEYAQHGYEKMSSTNGQFKNGKLTVQANPDKTFFTVEVAQ